MYPLLYSVSFLTPNKEHNFNLCYFLVVPLVGSLIAIRLLNMAAGISNSVAKQEQEQSQKEIGTLSINMKLPRTIPKRKGRKEVCQT